MPITLLLLSMPSIRKLFCVIGWPCALKPLSRSRLAVAGATPEVSHASCWKLRPFSGSVRISFCSTTFASVEVSDCNSGASAVTEMLSAIWPTSSFKSTRTRSCACNFDVLLDAIFLKPSFSTATS